MIITVTLNPAIDKTATLEKLVPAGLNRLQSVRSDAGGKGINVSKTIHELGSSTTATGFLGKENAPVFHACFEAYGIHDAFLYLDGSTRTNLKVMDAERELTELNEPGLTVSEEDQQRFLNTLRNLADEDTLFVFAGSLPKGVDPSFNTRMLEAVAEKGAKAFLDADGRNFREGLKAKPFLIKPNDYELSQYFGISEEETKKRRIELGRRLIAQGVDRVCISSGSEGSCFITREHVYRSGIVKVDVKSTVGAGDAMVAAFAYAEDAGMCDLEAFRLAVATSAGAVNTEGTQPPTRAAVDDLLSRVEIEEVEE